MIIQVKQEHIDRAIKAYDSGHFSSCHECIVAQAVSDVFPDKHISCGYCTLTIGSRDYVLPVFVTRKIEDFIERHSVEPFEFELDG